MKKLYFLIPLILISLFVFTGCEMDSKTTLVEGVDYNINGEFTGQYLDITKRGYYIDSLNQPDAPYLYIICMGEKNTGGYSIKVKEINRIDEKTEIIVEETAPGKNDIVTMAFTYPTVIVEFPDYQEDIVIKNTENEVFDLLQ